MLAKFRRAGCGVFISVCDDRNRSLTFACTGANQEPCGTSGGNRRDACARRKPGLLQGERQLNTEGNADLWPEYVSELRLKATRRLHFVCVKGHEMKCHIDRRTTTTLDRAGNDAADALASAATAHYAAGADRGCNKETVGGPQYSCFRCRIAFQNDVTFVGVSSRLFFHPLHPVLHTLLCGALCAL